MLVNLKEILNIAEEKNCAIGAFNTPTLEALIAVLNAAEKAGTPVIISHAELHDLDMNLIPLNVIGPIMVDMAKKSTVPVCVHLDHGTKLDYLKQSLELGFTSIMYDGSVLDYEENVKNTILAVEMAKEYGASVEGEIGVMTRRESAEADSDEGDGNDNVDMYTKPEMAKDFTTRTGIDALACAFGTAHGIYAKKPQLDFDRLVQIRNSIDVPIVMHGGSGVSPEDYVRSIDCGVRKINYYTYMAKAGADTVKAQIGSLNFFHDMAVAATAAMEADTAKAIEIFSNKK